MYKTTLDQWLVFKTVFEQGGFTAAAEALNRSQSTVSYSMSKLQKQLGVKLLEMDGKKCELTETGNKLLYDVYPLLEGFNNLEKKANFLSSGIEANIELVMDSIFPRDVLFAAIAQFAERYPFTQVHVQERIRFQPRDDEPYDIAIGVSQNGLIPGPKLLEVRLLLVAHKDHPVFKNYPHPVSINQLSVYKEIHYQHADNDVQIIGDMPRQRWAVNSVESAISAIRSKMCFGSLPEHSAKPLLESGELKVIDLIDPVDYNVPLYLMVKQSPTLGPATKHLAELILEHCRKLQLPNTVDQ